MTATNISLKCYFTRAVRIITTIRCDYLPGPAKQIAFMHESNHRQIKSQQAASKNNQWKKQMVHIHTRSSSSCSCSTKSCFCCSRNTFLVAASRVFSSSMLRFSTDPLTGALRNDECAVTSPNKNTQHCGSILQLLIWVVCVINSITIFPTTMSQTATIPCSQKVWHILCTYPTKPYANGTMKEQVVL